MKNNHHTSNIEIKKVPKYGDAAKPHYSQWDCWKFVQNYIHFNQWLIINDQNRIPWKSVNLFLKKRKMKQFNNKLVTWWQLNTWSVIIHMLSQISTPKKKDVSVDL